LTFQQIEEILGDQLPPEAYLYDAFWFESEPGMTLTMWKDEDYPFHGLIPEEPNYCISDSWQSQGYEIKALHRSEERVVFRRRAEGVSGLKIPDVLLSKKFPDKLVYKLENILEEFIEENGISQTNGRKK